MTDTVRTPVVAEKSPSNSASSNSTTDTTAWKITLFLLRFESRSAAMMIVTTTNMIVKIRVKLLLDGGVWIAASAVPSVVSAARKRAGSIFLYSSRKKYNDAPDTARTPITVISRGSCSRRT